MVVLSSLHVHNVHAYGQTECAECVAHHCHGHIGQAEALIDACVLCHFLSLTFVAAAFAAVATFLNVSWVSRGVSSCPVHDAGWGRVVTRGPPAV